ncbi:uncharacterized protein LOC118412381 [Branchiostoma floridae]|uniref:Uncharacterized protein LOC118412381 n=1 Tax=Branchiostoma floridae TaxID=7739 RepID=A0A9J7KWK9_BRAFL|nr:uncharacterized protein LOC118412381 [Branchiostoma floridae]
MKVVLLLAFVAAANAAWLCPNGDSDCDPGECCVRSFIINTCQDRPGLYDSCNNDALSVTGYCDCAEGLRCADYGTSAFSDFFSGDGWCVTAPAEPGSGNGV